MVNIFLCGPSGPEKEELFERIKALKGIGKHAVISKVQQNELKQRNINNIKNLTDRQLVEFHKWIIQKLCQLEKKDTDFLSESSAIDSLVQIHHGVNKGEANKLKYLPQFESSVAKHQSGLVILLLTPPSSFEDEAHQAQCKHVAKLYREYFHLFKIAYLELRSTDLDSSVDTVKKAIEYKPIPLETTRLQKYSGRIDSAEKIEYTSNFAFYKPEPNDSSNVHIPTISISEHMSEQNWTSHPKGETNRFLHRHGVQNLALMAFHRTVKSTTVQSMLKNGITINGSSYSFLGCSSKGLKERKCYLWKGSRKEVQDRLSENGAFERISSLPKRMARIGLLFSGVQLTSQVPEEVVSEDDIELNGKCFTDGCGGIGVDLARKIHEELEEDVLYPKSPTYLPSVYQMRYQGYKGVLALDPTLDGNSIKLRPSMKKFETTAHPCIGVCKQSKAHTFGHLNKQFIMLLSGLGVPDDVFLEKQEEHFNNVLEMGKDIEKTVRILQWQNKFDVAQTVMRHQGFEKCEPQVMKCIHTVQQKLMSKSEKLSVLIPESRNIFGVCDPTRTLKYNQCFVRITLGNLEQPETIRGNVVVCKNPCYLLGDVQVLTAVDVTDNPEVGKLNHLVDCIVFPVQGKRPHPDEIAGSDLDGDEFFVTWDSNLIPPKRKPPYEYIGYSTVSKEKDMIHYFAKQNETQKLTSRVDRYFNQWADLKGVTSDECQNLGKLFSRAIDSGKTGEEVVISPGLKPPNSSDESSVESQNRYVWQKMLKKAAKHQDEFKENTIRNQNPQSATDVSLSFIEEIIGQEFSNITEFDKFTFALSHLHEVEKVLDLFGDIINFALFSQEEKYEALLSGVPKDRLENALNWSSKLPHDDLAYFKMQTYRHPWSFYFKSEHEDFDWKLLLRALAEHDKTFIVFDIPDGITVVLQLLTRWNVGREQRVIAGTICGFFYSRRFGYRYKYILGSDYSLDLTEDTLQLYRNNQKTLTFVWLNASDCRKAKNKVTLGDETVNAISVNLLRFDSGILSNPVKPHPLVNKIPLLGIEVFAQNNSGIVPYLDTYEVNDGIPVPETEDHETEAEEDEVIDFETMMTCDEKYIIQTGEHLLQMLKDSAKKTKPLAFKMILETWKETNKEVPREVESCFIQLLEYIALSVPPFSLPDLMKDILDVLVKSMEYEATEVKCEVLGLLCRLGLEETARILCDKYESEIFVQTSGFLSLTSKWQIWWMMDNRTAELFLSKVSVHGDETSARQEPEQDTPQAQKTRYLAHFGKLQVLDLLQEMETAKQKMDLHKADDSISNLKVLKREDEETLTFYRNNELQHNPKITKGQYVAITRQSDFRRLQSFRACCCFAQVVSIRPAPLNVVVKICGSLPTMLKEQIDPDSERSSLWRLSLIANITAHDRVVDALAKLVSSDAKVRPSPDLLHLLVQPGGHPKGSPLSRDVPFSLPSNESGLHFEKDSGIPLNRQQTNALVSAVEQNVTLIQGPPGTGKTTVACHIIKTIQSIAKGDSKILVVAETNIAVDNIVKRLKEDLFLDILRLGSEGGIDPEVFDVTLEGQLKLLEERELKKATYQDKQGIIRRKTNLVKNLLKKAKIVLTTCAGAGDPELKSSTFKFVIVDEATQTKETTLLCSLGHGAKHLVMIGDPQQLGPVAVKEVSCSIGTLPQLHSLSTTLFHRLHRVLSKQCIFLDTQHRMHPALMKFPSDQFYDGKLVSAIGESERRRIVFPWPEQRPLCFINVDSREERIGTSFCNSREVDVVKKVFEKILNLPEEMSQFRLDTTEIGILSLYQGQVLRIRKTILGPAHVSSVDGFQGREKEVIIVSTVRANERGNLGFVDDMNRINVLLTRAKRGLIVVGNEQTLMASEIWRKWLTDAPRLAVANIESKSEIDQNSGNSGRRGNKYQNGQGRGGHKGGNQRRHDSSNQNNNSTANTSKGNPHSLLGCQPNRRGNGRREARGQYARTTSPRRGQDWGRYASGYKTGTAWNQPGASYERQNRDQGRNQHNHRENGRQNQGEHEWQDVRGRRQRRPRSDRGRSRGFHNPEQRDSNSQM